MGVLSDCYFPGNVRELENCVWRTATLASGNKIMDRDFACQNDGCMSAMVWKGAAVDTHPPGYMPLPIASSNSGGVLRRAPPAAEKSVAVSAAAVAAPTPVPHDCPAPGACPATPDQRSEKERLIQAMEKAGWVQAKAARILRLTPRQVGYALRKHGIELEKF